MRAVWVHCVVVVTLGLLSACMSAPLTCDVLLKPIEITTEEMLGKWMYIGSSSDIPGSRSLVYLLQSAWIEVKLNADGSTLDLIQTQRVYGSKCSTFYYNATLKNSELLMVHPFPLREVYLRTDECPDCLVAYETVVSGGTTFTSLIIFSKRKEVSHKELELFRRQVKCLNMPPPTIMKQENEICPDPDPSSPLSNLEDINALLASGAARGFGTIIDTLFDLFVN